MHLPNKQDTICALATAPGMGALAVIRISGNDTFPVLTRLFNTMKGGTKDFTRVRPYSIHYGQITDQQQVVDEVLVSIFRNPHSFTGEDIAEISCHGSVYIQQALLQLLQ